MQRLPGRHRLEPDRRGDVRQHVVAGEQQARGGVPEHHVPPGVAGRGDGGQGAGAHADLLVRREPPVRCLPVGGVAGQRAGDLAELLGEPGGPAGPQFRQLRRERAGGPAGQRRDRLLLAEPEGHRAAELPAQLDRERVVVAVHVRDQERADVAESGAEGGQRGGERGAGLLQCPAAVDEHEATVVLEHVDVHRPQPVGGQGQRYPVHPRGDRVRARDGPVVAGGLGVGGHGWHSPHPGSRPWCHHAFALSARGKSSARAGVAADMYQAQWHAMRSFTRDKSVTQQRLSRGIVRRIAGYARPYRLDLVIFLTLTALSAVIAVAVPLLLQTIIDRGILKGNQEVVLWVAGAVAGLAVLGAVLSFATRWFSARIGEGLIYDLRTEVYEHVQRQPLAFFVRAQTGSLVSRLNSDVIGAQQAITSTLSSVVANAIGLILVLAAMLSLSWLVTVVTLVMMPFFVIPARLVGRRLQRLTRESMQLDAEMGSTMTERFNVAGAMLVKLFGQPSAEARVFAGRAARVRDIGVTTAMYGSTLFIALSLLASMATAVVYGLGGSLVINGTIQLGTLVALAALLSRLYGPITALSNVQVDVMTALVSFDRVFEVLDLKPLIAERPGAVALPWTGQQNGSGSASALAVEFDHVSFRYPTASEVSLASLESIALPAPERTTAVQDVLRDVSFTAPAGQLTALVGPSGADKTTITHLMSRLYDPREGVVRVGGYDIADLTLDSLHEAVGVVTQDAHMFHDTIRANLSYARPSATEEDLIEACRAAQIWDLVAGLPDGLDTVVGDRGYRLSGGEKQRLAIARLLLKGPAVVVLDEATAHLDSESEAAVQRALKTALAGRTSLVIAHRLSTIIQADQILVIDSGRVVERGRHADLLGAGGLYADLYLTQFASQEQQPAAVTAAGNGAGQPASE